MNIKELSTEIRLETEKVKRAINEANTEEMKDRAADAVQEFNINVFNNIRAFEAANKKIDSWFDRKVMPLITDSAYSPWIILGVFVAGIVFGLVI
jgi:hypothetical protein